MIRSLCNLLRDRINHLPYLTKKAGLVQVNEYYEGQTTAIKRRPISFDVIGKEDVLTSLVPDDNEKGIFYIEQRSETDILERSNTTIKYRVNLRFILWYKQPEVHQQSVLADSIVVANLIKAYPQHIPVSGLFSKITILNQSMPITSSALFSPYTYDNAGQQYLMYPKSAKALDVDIEYITGSNPEACI